MRNSIYFSKDDILKLKENSNSELKNIVKELISTADEIMNTQPLPEEMVSYSGNDNGKYGNQHENYYDAANPFKENIPILAFAYFYTGNKNYFQKAKEFMLMYSSYRKWHGKGWNGRSELVTAAFCLGMGYGYALFYDELTEKERKTIAEATYRLGIMPTFEDWLLPETKIHVIDTMGHNWWAVIISNAGLATIAMSDIVPDYDRLVRLAAKGLYEWFSYSGNAINAKPVNIDDGAFYESVSYFDFALSEYLRFSMAYVSKCHERPFDDGNIVFKASEFFAKMTYVSETKSEYVNFGDTGSFNKNKESSSVLNSPFLMFRQGIDIKYANWYISNIPKKKTRLEDALFFDEIHSGIVVAPEENSAYYSKIGWAMFRDGYEKNGTLLAIKCGDSWNHAHCDAGSFILCKDGRDEIYDSGSCAYVNPLYVNYYVTSRAHNVILFNGKGQDERDFRNHARLKGKLYNFVDQEGFRYVAADATGPMSRYFRKHIRHFLWLEGFILIYDDIESYEDGVVSFLLHAEDKTCFRMLTDCSIEENIGYRTYSPEKEEKYYSYSQTTDNCRAKFVSALVLDNSLKIESKEMDNAISIKAGKTKVHINLLSDGRIMHHNCITEVDGVTTDAVMLVEQDSRYGVINGSIVRKYGKSHLDTFTRINGWTET